MVFFSQVFHRKNNKKLVKKNENSQNVSSLNQNLSILGWRKNNSYFYFSFLIFNCVIYSIKKIFAKGTVKEKIFRGRLKALEISIFFKMMNFFLHQTITATIVFYTLTAYENT